MVAKERKADLESQSSVWQAVTGLAREKAPDDLALMSVGEFWESSLPKPTLSRTLPSETKQGKGAIYNIYLRPKVSFQCRPSSAVPKLRRPPPS